MASEEFKRAVQTYGIPVDLEDLEAALADPDHGAAFAAWATTCLTSDNLLSTEELSL
jgi:hypothetical protein